MRAACFTAACMLLVGSAGCGGGAADAPQTATAAGVVNYDGKPVADATVVFHPDSGPVGVGKTDASGEFRIKTNGSDGAPVGSNKVTVVAETAASEAPPMDGNETALFDVPKSIPAKYAKKETTDLLVDVPENGIDSLTLDLTD